MDNTYWFRQDIDKPLFPDIIWSKPENKNQAGKLLIVGGSAQSFAKVAYSYQQALKAGIGQIKVLLPDVLKKTIDQLLPGCEFAPSTPSGSFGSRSLDTILELSNWADGILFPGDLGRNSETAIVLEKFLRSSSSQITITRDAVDYFRDRPKDLLERKNTTLVVSFADLQRLISNAGFPKALVFEMELLRFVDILHELSLLYKANIICLKNTQLFVSSEGKVSSTNLGVEPTSWRIKTAAAASSYLLQNHNKVFEALTTSLLVGLS